MGCWGISAFESDNGLDAVGIVRRNIPEDGKLELGLALAALVKEGYVECIYEMRSHTGPMALAELYFKFADHDISGLDYDDDSNKFSSVKSFTADKGALTFLRNHISSSYEYSLKNEREANTWFKREDWDSWKSHMEKLTNRLDEQIMKPEILIELVPQTEQTGAIAMEPELQMG